MDVSRQTELAAHELLKSGYPFCPFPEYSLTDLPPDVLEWVGTRLDDGRPFVLRGFDKLDTWDHEVLNKNSLFQLLSLDSFSARNCQTGRDIRVSAREFTGHTSSHRKGKGAGREMLYAKDLQCPQRWVETLYAILPEPFRCLGSLDLFRALPKQITPEVLMAYVGSRNSVSGFHRCFSGTVALNLMLEVDGNGPGAVCCGTDWQSQGKYDRFMESLGRSPQTDWTNISPAQMRDADFPIYVYDQKPGDLVVFPSMTAHQVWNVTQSVTKIVWNILHFSSAKVFMEDIHPAYQRQCHVDTARVPLVLFNFLKTLRDTNSHNHAKDAEVVTNLFQLLVDEEAIEQETPESVRSVDTQGSVVECNFCGCTIWNRHLRCDTCGDFDLCMSCFVSGRSCKHTSAFTLMQIEPITTCNALLRQAWVSLGASPRLRLPSSSRPLGTLTLQAMHSHQDPKKRLCHLCRDDHLQWKGIVCERCSSFFCFRGLFRHFDVETIPLLRSRKPWVCPKCSHLCNCRCCHFPRPYKQKHRPPRARVKAIDPRGSVSGFTDNVFDHKRTKESTTATSSSSAGSPVVQRGQKRRHVANEFPAGISDETFLSQEARSSFRDSQLKSPRVASARTSLYRDPPSDHQPPLASESNSSRAECSLRIEDLLTQEGTSWPSAESVNRQQIMTPSNLLPDKPTSPERAIPDRRFSHAVPARFEQPVTQTPTFVRNQATNITATAEPEDLASLERQAEALNAYANDLLELSLTDSHARVLDRARQVQAQIEDAKLRKAQSLLSNMRTEFPDLADIALAEARRRGLVPSND